MAELTPEQLKKLNAQLTFFAEELPLMEEGTEEDVAKELLANWDEMGTVLKENDKLSSIFLKGVSPERLRELTTKSNLLKQSIPLFQSALNVEQLQSLVSRFLSFAEQHFPKELKKIKQKLEEALKPISKLPEEIKLFESWQQHLEAGQEEGSKKILAEFKKEVVKKLAKEYGDETLGNHLEEQLKTEEFSSKDVKHPFHRLQYLLILIKKIVNYLKSSNVVASHLVLAKKNIIKLLEEEYAQVIKKLRKMINKVHGSVQGYVNKLENVDNLAGEAFITGSLVEGDIFSLMKLIFEKRKLNKEMRIALEEDKPLAEVFKMQKKYLHLTEESVEIIKIFKGRAKLSNKRMARFGKALRKIKSLGR